MNTLSLKCPRQALLHAFVKGTLPEDSLNSVFEHVSTCDRCATLLSDLESDDHFRITEQGSSMVALLAEPQLNVLKKHSVRLLERTQDDDEDPITLSQVGEYTLLRPIGRGGMGHVFEALHRRLHRRVAIKLLPTRNATSRRYRDRFIDEMRAIGQCEHRNIVRATDAGEFDGHLYLVMELLHGQDAGKLLREQGRLSIAEACEIARQTAAALQYVYDSGIVHRDIKPSNLYVTDSGDIKLLDLGLARLRLEGSETETGMLLGTMDFLAPEQAASAKDASIRSDLYGLGCTLYAFLAGAAPYYRPGQSGTEKLLAHRQDPIPDIRSVRPEVPDRVAELIVRLLAKQPEDRPALPREVEAELLPFGRLALPATDAVLLPSSNSPQAIEPKTQPDRKRISRRGLVLAMTPLGVAAAAGAYFRSGNKPEVRRMPEVGKWFDLLRERPTPLLFPNNDRNSTFTFDDRAEHLWVSSDQVVLVELGEARSANFQLQVALRQQVWTGGAGLYFGRTDNSQADSKVIQFHTVEMRPHRPRDDSDAFAIAHTQRTVTLAGVAVPDVDSKRYGSAGIALPARREYVLEIIVRQARLHSVKWDGRELMQELWPAEHPLIRPPKVDKGGFGIVNYVSATTYTRARVLLLED